MASTRSKSSSDKNQNPNNTESELILLTMVKELIKVQESTIKSFLSVYMDSRNKRID